MDTPSSSDPLRESLDDFMQSARDMFDFDRNRYGGSHRGELDSEIALYQVLIASFDSGLPITDVPGGVPGAVVGATLSAFDHSILRWSEDIEFAERRQDAERAAIAKARLAKLQRMRDQIALAYPGVEPLR